MELTDFEDIVLDIHSELLKAQESYHNFHSTHEGYGVIKEELDELWDKIKESKSIYASGEMRQEAIQVATTAIRFILDLYNK